MRHGWEEGFAITGVASVFPGSATAEAFWERILAAAPAPRTSLAAAWGIDRARILGPVGAPNRTYLDLAFMLPWDTVPSVDPDPQIAVGRHVVSGALASAARAGTPLDRSATALVVGTSWSAPSYFREDARRTAGGKPSSDIANTPERQLELLAGDLGGPRIAVDTACASSLYAVEAATRLLGSGQANAAVVVGLNALLTPFLYVGFSKLRALSPEGRILPFAADASGIVPGEGAGAIVLEPLHLARAAGRSIWAVVRSVGLSSDGAERSVFAPGERGERLAYERAFRDLDPADVDYVEAHGTATTVGDETELRTLEAFFGARRTPARPLLIGSVKAIIGHTLAAAGMASIVKGIGMLRAGVVPPHVPVTANEHLSATRLVLPNVAERIPSLPDSSGRPRPARMGISGFGFGGSNAHLVLEAAPLDSSSSSSPSPRPRPRARRPLAVIDMRVVVGGITGVAAVAAAMREGRPLRQTTFATDHAIDAHGLRMGPNLLRRLDPLQLLLAAHTRDALEALPSPIDPERTGVVIASNLGGDTSLRLSRRDLFAAGDADPGDLHVETIASSLPSMASGYPAYHLDLRGFHETIAGGVGAFTTLLRTAPEWLEDSCDLLVVGAARLMKSPLEWGTGDDAFARAREGEGMGIVLLTTLEHAASRGWPVRGVLRLEETQSRDTVRGDAERTTFGKLGEATGLATLAMALAGEPHAGERSCHVDVDVEGSGGAWRFAVERGASFEIGAVRAPRLPMTVSFTRALPFMPVPVRAPMPVSEPSPANDASLSPAARLLLDGIRASEQAASAVFESQRDALSLLGVDGVSERGADEPRANSVLEAVHVSGALVSATIVVRESDSYFFDHPLDHVPGILLLAGVEELALRACAAPRSHVSSLVVQFRRFCEKNRSIRVELEGASELRGRIVQEGRDVALVEVRTTTSTREVVDRSAPVTTAGRGLVDAAKVHKRRIENVMVGPLETREGQFVCDVRPAPEGHFLRGALAFASALFILEASRQVVMLGAHDVMQIPLGLPMNLLRMSLDVERPVPGGAALEATLRLGQKYELEGMVLADVVVELALSGQRERMAVVRLKAQVVDAATYDAQRSRE